MAEYQHDNRRADLRSITQLIPDREHTHHLRLNGRSAEIHVDLAVALANGPQSMVQWQGDQFIDIDRFDARAHLDFYREPENTEIRLTEDEEREERMCNFERYHVLFQNDCNAVSEGMWLHKIELDEADEILPAEESPEDMIRQLAVKKAAIPYTYEDSTHKKSTKVLKEKKQDSSCSILSAHAIDIHKITSEQAKRLNMGSEKYGFGDKNYEHVDIEAPAPARNRGNPMDMAKIMEDARARVLARLQNAKDILRTGHDRMKNCPSYAQRRGADRQPPRARASSSVPPPGPETVSFISSFGGDEDVQGPALPPNVQPATAPVRASCLGPENPSSQLPSVGTSVGLPTEAMKRINKLRSLRAKTSPNRSTFIESNVLSVSPTPQTKSQSRCYRRKSMSRSRSRSRTCSRSSSGSPDRNRRRESRRRSRSRSHDRRYSSSRSRFGSPKRPGRGEHSYGSMGSSGSNGGNRSRHSGSRWGGRRSLSRSRSPCTNRRRSRSRSISPRRRRREESKSTNRSSPPPRLSLGKKTVQHEANQREYKFDKAVMCRKLINNEDSDDEARFGLSKLYCMECDQEFQCNTTFQVHLDGKKHMKVIKDCDKHRRSLHVTDVSCLARQKNALKEYFSQFGKIEKIRLHKRVAAARILFCEEVGRREALVRTIHVVEGTEICVAPVAYNIKENNQLLTRLLHDEFQKYEEDTLLCQSLLEVISVDQQIHKLISAIGLTPEEQERREECVHQLQKIFRQFLPELTLTTDGSDNTFFATKHSGIYISVDTDPNQAKQGTKQASGKSTSRKHKEAIENRENYNKASDVEKLEFLVTTLKTSNILSMIRDLHIVHEPKASSIKFYHSTLNVNVDICLGDSISVQNTNLLMLLCTMDARFKTLMMIILYWARHVGVTSDDKGNSLTSNALALLVYFYLENTEPPVLPTTEDLDNINLLTEKGIHIPMGNLVQLLLPERNLQTIPDLLGGFFIFYANIDLFNVVICPRTGKIVDVLLFKEKVKADPAMQGFVYKDMTLQDPLELSHNTLGNVRQSATRILFSEEIIKAAFQVIREPTNWSLHHILGDSKPRKLQVGLDQERPQILFPFQLPLLPPLFANFGSAMNVEAQWHQWVVELALRVLGVLQIEYEIIAEYDANEDDLFPDVYIPHIDAIDPNVTEPYAHAVYVPESDEDSWEEDSPSSTARNDEYYEMTSATGSAQCKPTKQTDFFTTRPVYKHPFLNFNMEKVIKEETIVKCCSIQEVWQRYYPKQRQVDLHREDFRDLFSLEENITKTALNLLPHNDRYAKCRTMFILTLQRFSYGHNTYMEIKLEGHRNTLQQDFVRNLSKHFNRLIGSVIFSSHC